MSVPEANDWPAPFSTSTRISWSASTRSQAATSASYISHVSAFLLSGRLNVNEAMGPSTAKRVGAVDMIEGPPDAGSRTMSDDTKALAGVRVVDLTQVMAGPFCAMQLCDMGADVIKVEPPEGDSTRRMSGAVGSDSHSFNAVNRGKRGIVLDLRSTLAREACLRLIRRADVVVENCRPGVMRRFGLDYDTLAPASPGLIYASISGYG